MLVTPPAVAVMLVVPLATAVAKPVALTVAVASVLLAHVNAGCVARTLPFASSATALSCTVAPTEASVAVAGVTTTDATAGGPLLERSRM